MWRLVTGWVFIIVGFAALGTELFALIVIDHFLLLNPTLTVIRLAIWGALIWFGFRMKKPRYPQQDDIED